MRLYLAYCDLMIAYQLVDGFGNPFDFVYYYTVVALIIHFPAIIYRFKTK